MAEVTPELIKQLRQRTGAGLLDCKKALLKTNGDLEAAADHLREQGLAVETPSDLSLPTSDAQDDDRHHFQGILLGCGRESISRNVPPNKGMQPTGFAGG